MRKYIYLIILYVSCGGNAPESTAPPPAPIVTGAPAKSAFQGIIEDTVAGVGVTLVNDNEEASDSLATLLVLPGWDFERHRWLNETKLRDEAKKNHCILILPEMKRSIYASHFYTETSPQASKEKTGTWVTDTFIPAIQKKYQLLLIGKPNFTLGLSTGGRGAVYSLYKKPEIFKAAASLSGDFDQTLTPDDFLVTEVYGSYYQFAKRWSTDDNLYAVADSIHQPIYLAHGDADKVVSMNQSTAFYARIKKSNAQVQIHLAKNAGHDFKFWGGELMQVFDFFGKVK